MGPVLGLAVDYTHAIPYCAPLCHCRLSREIYVVQMDRFDFASVSPLN